MNRNETMDPIERKIQWMSANFNDAPERVSGWLHDYVCDKCSSLLQFKIDGGDYACNSFTCPKCGRILSGKKYLEAWTYQYRRWFAEQIMNVALRTDLEEAVEFLQTYIDFYADHYLEFQLHGEHIGKGRIMSQSLDEAVFSINLLKAVFFCKTHIESDVLEKWYLKLFRPMAEMLKGQVDSIYNISVWIQCSIAMTGLVFEDELLWESSCNGEFGLLNQLEEGCTKDNLWNEGSLHYHFYVLEALTALSAVLIKTKPGHPIISKIKKMYFAPLALSSDGWELPSLNDGWKPITLSTYGDQIIQAAYLTNDERLRKLSCRIIREDPALLNNPCVRAVLQNQKNEMSLAFDDHVAIVERPFWMTLKSGSIKTIHSHYDCLSITLEPVSKDLGTPGYGSSLTKKWYRHALSHSCVAIDGQQLPASPDNYCTLTDTKVSAFSFTREGNDVIRAERCLEPNLDYVTDRTRIDTRHAHVFDWIFHGSSELIMHMKKHSAVLKELNDSYHLFEDVYIVDCERAFFAEYVVNNDWAIGLEIQLPEKSGVYVAKTPGNPSDEKRNTILVRVDGSSINIEARYHWIDRKEEGGTNRIRSTLNRNENESRRMMPSSMGKALWRRVENFFSK